MRANYVTECALALRSPLVIDGCVALDERACDGQHGGGGTEAGNVPLIALTISESLTECLRGVGG